MRFRFRSAAVAAALSSPFTGQAFAQQRAMTDADYARAEKFMGYNTTPLVVGSAGRASWLPGERFWYRVTTAAGSEFILVDAAKGTRTPAFDQAVASSQQLVVETIVDQQNLQSIRDAEIQLGFGKKLPPVA